jgi:hypothetical protein
VLTLADLAACIEELEDIDRAAHQAQSPMVSEALAALFHASA